MDYGEDHLQTNFSLVDVDDDQEDESQQLSTTFHQANMRSITTHDFTARQIHSIIEENQEDEEFLSSESVDMADFLKQQPTQDRLGFFKRH